MNSPSDTPHRLRHWVDSLLFSVLWLAYMASGVFEVIDNLAGERTRNTESSAPAAAKVGKELMLILIVAILLLRKADRETLRLRLTSAVVSSFFLLLALSLPAYAFLHSGKAPTVGMIYLTGSLLMIPMYGAVREKVDMDGFLKYFLFPTVIAVLATQLMELRYAPVSMYHETGLLGLDRRAGIAVIPTTAGCLAALALFRARSWFMRIVSVLVLLIANSTIAWGGALLLVSRGIKDKRWLLVAGPLLMALFAGVVVARGDALSVSLGSRLGLWTDTLDDLQWLSPSDIGASATAKSVATSVADSFIADSTLLEFLHVFGIIPGAMIYLGIVAYAGRVATWRAAVFFIGASSGFLYVESWVLMVSLIWTLGQGTAIPASDQLTASGAEQTKPAPSGQMLSDAPS